MAKLFYGSTLKIERANEHIAHLDSLLETFIHSGFYDLAVEKDTDSGKNFLRLTIKIALPAERYALIIGDALHNLRSALDLAYHEAVIMCGGEPSKWTRFPVLDTREELISTKLDPALEKKQISLTVYNLILDVIKPYKTGNPALWMLDDLNIIDKHELLIPVLQLVMVGDVRLEDEYQRPIIRSFMFGDGSVALVKGADGLNLTVKDKGHATAHILLAQNILKQINEVVPTLRGIAVEVTNTIVQFDLIFFGLASGESADSHS
jgi:hypothetical protein